MELYRELEDRLLVKGTHNVVSVTGGGGKTTLLRLFGRYLSDKGYSVLITTTTKIQDPETFDYGVKHVLTDEKSALAHEVEKGDFVFYGEHHPTLHKMVSPELDVLSTLTSRFDVTLIEADGSRHLPLKIHSDRDPVILEESTAFVGIMASDGIGKVAGDVTFGLEGDERIVDSHFLDWYFSTPEGALKGFTQGKPSVILVNRADESPVPDPVFGFRKNIDVLVASEENNEIYSVL